MKSRTLRIRHALFLSVFLFGIFGESWGQASLTLSCQDAFFPTQFNSGGDFFNQSASVLGMWANQGAKQTVAWRNFKTAGDDSGSNRSLQIGDEFTITISCTRAFGQIGFSLNSAGSQGSSYANNVSGSKLRINTDNYGSWYISNGSTSSSFDYNPSENTFRDYKFVIKILSPTLISANLFVNGVWFSGVQNFSLLNSNPITALSIYGSDMWDGSSNDNAFWKDCSVTATTTVELGYGLSSGNLNPGLITNGLIANSNATISNNAVFIGGNAGTSIILDQANSFSGLTTVNQNATLQLNSLSGNTVPSTNSITVTNGGTLRISSNQTLNNLTINAGGIVIVDANVQLTIDGTLTNNGTLTLKTGATLDPGTSYAQAGNGVYNVEQFITGAGGATPSGRFWYVGSPVASATSNVYDAAGSNVVKGWNEAGNAWSEITDNTTSLTVGKGYYIRAGADATLNFTGGELNNGAQTINLTRTGTTNSSRGFNLVSNPYPSYLDWDGVTRSSGVSSTIWYRTANASNVNVFDTYNASGGTGTNTNGAGAVTRYIPPMQSYWVFVTPYNTTGTISFDNADRSHYQTGVQGLRSTAQDFPMFLRLNVEQGTNRDQIILYMKPEASSAYDQFDSDKMFLSGTPQLYTKIADKKLVINGMKNNKKQTSVPLFIDIPSSGLFTLHAEEFNVEDGLILLEDKQEQMIQDITLNDTYTFYAASGICSNRFVIHFKMPNAVPTAQGPSNNWVDDQTVLNEVGDVQITSDARGKVVITLDQAEDVKTEGMVQVTDANGRVVYSGVLEGVQSIIQLNVPSGIYYLTVQSGNSTENKKVFIQD
jgi:hypothetical protein